MLAWIPRRQRPGAGALFNIFVIGLSMDAALALPPEITGLPLRLGLMTAGVVLTAMGGTAYIGAGMGAVVFAVGIGPLIQIFLPWFLALGRDRVQARA